MTPNALRTDAWADQLVRGCDRLGVAVAAPQRARLLAYLALLAKWNRAFNLTAVRDPAIMVRRQLLDSLSILPWVDAGPVLDVGTGAGLPGIPLAIVRPGLAFSLLDSNGKKVRFVQQAVGELGLANVEVVRDRVETYRHPGGFARITSRAFANLADMLEGSVRLIAPGGAWLAMKGAPPHAEIRDLPPGYRANLHALAVPGEAGDRHLVVIERDAVAQAPG